jgi:hypothetical protein
MPIVILWGGAPGAMPIFMLWEAAVCAILREAKLFLLELFNAKPLSMAPLPLGAMAPLPLLAMDPAPNPPAMAFLPPLSQAPLVSICS